MKRLKQSFEEIYNSLIPIEASWLDDHAEDVIELLRKVPGKTSYELEDLGLLLDQEFEAASTIIRLFLEMSKDEYRIALKDSMSGHGGVGITRFRNDRKHYLESLASLGALDRMSVAVNRPVHWSDLLIERLKGGRGSAIKGQRRGRGLEDFVEEILLRVFSPELISPRCRFVGATGMSTEKADFAVPNNQDPQILIEVKAYGATGSKQTDVLGDISRIVEEKRNDTVFFLVTDGITWRERSNDLRKLVALQNKGSIQRIYTKSMSVELESDLKILKHSLQL